MRPDSRLGRRATFATTTVVGAFAVDGHQCPLAAAGARDPGLAEMGFVYKFDDQFVAGYPMVFVAQIID